MASSPAAEGGGEKSANSAGKMEQTANCDDTARKNQLRRKPTFLDDSRLMTIPALGCYLAAAVPCFRCAAKESEATFSSN